LIILDIPGFGELNIKNLVLDMNGTIAVDGKINREIKKLIETLSRKLNTLVLQ
jgi:soluble P-type ATPase